MKKTTSKKHRQTEITFEYISMFPEYDKKEEEKEKYYQVNMFEDLEKEVKNQ